MPAETRCEFADPSGQKIDLRHANPLFRDLLRHAHPPVDGQPVQFSLDNPLGDVQLAPGQDNPICQKCRMWSSSEPLNPFLPYAGNQRPLVTFVFEAVSTAEDKAGYVGAGGWIQTMKRVIDQISPETGVSSRECRFVPLTRCAHRVKTPINYRSKGTYCRLFALQELWAHPPRVIVPVGSTALGLLCHKSNVQDWGGHILTWRGWPDDWLTNPAYVKPRKVLVNGQAQEVTGHPVFGPPPGPEARLLLYPIQSPRLICAAQNNLITQAWSHQIKQAMLLAKSETAPPVYDLEHYRLLDTAQEVVTELQWLIDHPGTLVSYDTETEGLYPFAGQKIVFMMFRYTRPDGTPVAFGFPWDYKEDEQRGPASPLLSALPELRPCLEEALSVSVLTGHNIAFDILFTFCNLIVQYDVRAIDEQGRIKPAWRSAMRRLERLADAAVFDTWHMAYTRHQQRGSLGLELLAYAHTPLGGYEEDLSLLIELERTRMHPDEGGHYARCPPELWESHFKPYVLGDVEVCYQARDRLEEILANAEVYPFPLASIQNRGRFRYYRPPSRAWLYEKIMSPAARVLIKMMGRGVFIDQKVLGTLEQEMPKAIGQAIEAMRNIKSGAVLDYIGEMTRADTHQFDAFDRTQAWSLDLESKEQLREILFNRMNLKIQRLTKNGRELYGEDPEQWAQAIQEAILEREPHLRGTDLSGRIRAETLKYAALDKFTLNKLAVDYPEVRPLQNYRHIYKLYTAYVRPMRNYRSKSVDKKERTDMPHLCLDGLVHCNFMVTGTRSGRLSARNPNLQQIPKEGYAAREGGARMSVKEMYVSRFGKQGCLFGTDLSQVELRLLAAASGDPTMIDAYLKGIDLHTLTTSRIFNLPYETFSKEHMKWLENHGRADEAKELKIKRDCGKTVNFLTGYGGGALGLQTILASRQIYKQLEECEDLIYGFFDTYPAVRDLLSYYKKFIEQIGAAVSIFGRVRVLQEAFSGDDEIQSKALRAGCNHLIQSTASDMMLIALCVIEQMMRDEGLDSMLILCVHDSFVIDARRSELPKIHSITSLVMNNLRETFEIFLGPDFDLSWMLIPFGSDSEVGRNYAAMKGVPQDEDPDWDRLLDG
jgi:DNA polymerase I-like protein with 3'-5' exonuclease and polymerase domains